MADSSEDILSGLVLRSTRPPAAEPPKLLVEHPLEPTDIARINSGELCNSSDQVDVIEKIRFKHHLAARLIADGLSVNEAAISSGYAASTLYVLKGDPTFRELIEHYKRSKDEIFRSAYERMGVLTMTAMEVLQERLDDPEREMMIPTDEVRKIVEMAADRSIAPSKAAGKGVASVGGGVAQGKLVVNLNFSEPKKEDLPPQVVIDIEANEED